MMEEYQKQHRSKEKLSFWKGVALLGMLAVGAYLIDV